MKKTILVLSAMCSLLVSCGDKTPANSYSVTSDGRINVTDAVIVMPGDSTEKIQMAVTDGSSIGVRQVESNTSLATFPYNGGKAEVNLSTIEEGLKMQKAKEFFSSVIPNCEISDGEAEVAAVILSLNNGKGREIGDFNLSNLSTTQAENATQFSIISQLYSSEDLVVKGEIGEMGLKIAMDLDLKKGWNNFVTSTEIDTTAEMAVIRFSNSVVDPQSFKWTVRTFVHNVPSSGASSNEPSNE